jgi:iron complex outermembrane receptor protein
MLKRTVLARSLLIAFSGNMFGAGYVLAQDAQPATGSQLERVTVTGSNIRRVDSETPSPVQILNSEQLKASGYTTISEVLQSLTSNGMGTLSNAFPGAFAGSATGISLRGLTTAATLVLIDGHRMAPFPLSDDGQRSFVDISSIPFDAVERIEVLKDGASATYGSDAIAGVVNIILKRRFTGTQVTAEVGTATEGGGTTTHASIIHGFGNLDADGYNAYVNLEYRHANDITQQQRQGKGAWSNLDQTAVGGVNQTPGIIRPGNPTPPPNGTVYIVPTTGSFSAANSKFYSSPIAPNAAYGGGCTYASLTAGNCGYTNPHAEIAPQTQNINLIGSFTKKLGNDWTLDLKGSVFDSSGEQYSAGRYGNGLTYFSTTFNPQVAVSAGVLPHLVGGPSYSITVPANYPGNTLGLPSKVHGIDLDAPIAHTELDSKSYRFVADLTGSLAGWDIDTSLGYTRVNTTQNVYGGVNLQALSDALNRATNPYLITGGNTAADISTIYPSDSATDTSTLQFAEFNATRSLMDLKGGSLGLSLGGEYIHRVLNAPAPTLIAQGIVSGNNAYVKGSQTDTAVYAELSAPIFKMLELDAHARYDHFDNAGNAFTPQIGFKFTPIPEFALRGTLGRGFRAPNAAENGQAGQAYSAGTASDPLLCPNGAGAAGAVVSQCNYNVVYLNAANPNLKPEKSVSGTIGFILEPVKGWSTTFDMFQVTIKNQIVAGVGDPANAVRGNPVSETCSDGNGGTVSCTPQYGEILYIPVQFVNANSTKVNGWELDTKYRLAMGEWGSMTAELDWSHTMSYVLTIGGMAYQLAGTHGPTSVGGNTGNPKDRIQGTLIWDRGPLHVSTTLNWISSIDLTDPSVGINTCSDGLAGGGYYAPWVPSGTSTDSSVCRVHSFFTTDISASYKVTKNWSVHGSVTNLFNRQAPLDLNTYGGGNLPYNPSLHQAGAVGRFLNVGAVYNF